MNIGTAANAKSRIISRTLVRKFAFQLSRSPGFSRSDYEDLLQALNFRAEEALKRYDPKRSSVWGYLQSVLTNEVRNIVRYQRAACRHPFTERSLHTPVHIGDGHFVERGEILDHRDRFRHRGVKSADAIDAFVRSIDVRKVLLNSPPELRNFGVALMSKSTAQIARDWGVPRTSLTHLKKRLAHRLERAGLAPQRKSSRQSKPAPPQPEPQNLGKPLRRFRRADFA